MSDTSSTPPNPGPKPIDAKPAGVTPQPKPMGVSPAPGASSTAPADRKDAAEIAQEAKADVEGEMKAAATEAHSRGAAVTSEIRSEAEKAAAQARKRAEATAREYQEAAADRGRDMAERLRAAGHEFGDGSLPDQYVGRMADSLSSAADAIAKKDLGTLLADTASLARRNPGAFIGGAALLGFAAARFLKSTAPENRDDHFDSVYDADRYEPRSYDPAVTPAPAPRPGAARVSPTPPYARDRS